MNQSIKSAFQTYVRLFIFLSLPAFSAFTPIPELSNSETTECTCEPPQATKTGQSSGAISFAWNAVNGATGYQVWYVRKSDNYMSSPINTTATSHTFSGLSAGAYVFYFVTDCGNESSGFVVVEDLIVL